MNKEDLINEIDELIAKFKFDTKKKPINITMLYDMSASISTISDGEFSIMIYRVLVWKFGFRYRDLSEEVIILEHKVENYLETQLFKTDFI